MDTFALHILSPEGTLLKGAVSLLTLPGIAGPFTVLPGHAPLVTALEAGRIRYIQDGQEHFLPIREGFAEVTRNGVNVCVEV